MKGECDRLWEIDTLREGRLSRADADAHRRHSAVCDVCRQRFAADEHLATLGRALDGAEPEPLRTRRLRARILRAAATTQSSTSRWTPTAVLAVLCLAASAAYVFKRDLPVRRLVEAPGSSAVDAQAPFAAIVMTMPGARWSRRRDGDVERTVLDEGTIALQVRKQHAGERFVVDLPDGEIEVRGTTFEVTVRDHVTTAIHVEEGVVVFRRPHAPEVALGQRSTWPADEAASGKTSASTGGARASLESPPAAEYERAVATLHAQQYADAARRFSSFVAAHPNAPEAEDAAFLEASALAHGGRADAAAKAAERFLGRYPSSFHARDAAILVARSARDRGDCSRARHVLARWSSSPTSEIESALGSCVSGGGLPE
jgi:TolA-binding protein